MPERATTPSAAGDGLALILNTPNLPHEAIPEQRANGIPRAPRFTIRLPVRYRLEELDEWYNGETENMSQSGVAFRTAQSDLDFAMAPLSDDGVRVEMVFEVPGQTDQAPKVAVRCRGLLVRASRGVGLGQRTHVAVRVRGEYGVAAAHQPLTN